VNRERIVTQRLVLEPVGDELARAIVAGDTSGVRAGEGWPHADTLDGLRLGLLHGAGTARLALLDGVVVGDCGTHGPADASGEVEIGYGLAEPCRGRGLGSELVLGYSDWLLVQEDVRRVVAGVLAENVPSRRALARAGFALEGEREGEGGKELTYARHR
jgi:RimJ/RimL family protein N-acetyltransferase